MKILCKNCHKIKHESAMVIFNSKTGMGLCYEC